MTVTILIGNADNKLTQQEWSEFVDTMRQQMLPLQDKSHFFGGPATHERLQNVCWVLEVDDQKVAKLRAVISEVRASFKQDSAAMICGETEFI
ncbi:MAG: hypothetical protein IAG10_02005 [Planctomycetaceae bacterium]|nr:hypothetical protein [Planctomycetaceae bacterium]